MQRGTPQATMESFLALGRENRWQDAAHLLDLANFPQEEQAEIGPELEHRQDRIVLHPPHPSRHPPRSAVSSGGGVLASRYRSIHP